MALRGAFCQTLPWNHTCYRTGLLDAQLTMLSLSIGSATLPRWVSFMHACHVMLDAALAAIFCYFSLKSFVSRPSPEVPLSSDDTFAHAASLPAFLVCITSRRSKVTHQHIACCLGLRLLLCVFTRQPCFTLSSSSLGHLSQARLFHIACCLGHSCSIVLMTAGDDW